MAGDVTGEVTDLLQHLIRNECVNDGTAASGHETRSVDLLRSYLPRKGLDVETYEPTPGRASLVARIEGTDPAAPTVLLMGHTDVVPANPEGWERDPFGGELIEGEVWGRGAVDMLNLTSSMAVAMKLLAADKSFKPKGTIVYLAVADEEALGTHGAEYLVEHEWDAVQADYVITESGGIPLPSPTGPKLTVNVAEKGAHWCRLRVHGTPAHASRPLRTDNALVKAAEIVRRIAEYRPETRIHEVWRRFVEGMSYPPDLTAALLDADRLWGTVHEMGRVDLARTAHACTHATFAPTIMHAGAKTNVIPDRVDLEIDIRTLPGHTAADVDGMLDDIIGPDLRDSVQVSAISNDEATASPIDTPLWSALESLCGRLAPGATLVPSMMTGATDARFFRRRGVHSYGFGLFSGRIPPREISAMYHGNNERVDTESLRLSTELWTGLSKEFLG
ncbi:MAG TPA: M20/M25/M40 family metallo-hydrolase [Acidimicrobiales bacterium]|jgi:acetylornithine deacetylase/succinyl-diaminopimelate desuccinylase-like protein|nr:M20/M25/M40 family metallo-hydrolase [Acidimicrobiales bacterium]